MQQIRLFLTNYWRFYAFCVFFGALIFSCKKSGNVSTEHKVTCNGQNSITWNKYVRFLVQTSCAVSGCHINKDLVSGDYRTYAGLRASIDDGSFERNVLILNNQPKGAMLGDSILVRLECWFQNGAPE
jgi:hypothetical protein